MKYKSHFLPFALTDFFTDFISLHPYQSVQSVCVCVCVCVCTSCTVIYV